MSTKRPILLNYLVFDDEDEEINQNKINVKLDGYDCHLIFINPQEFYDAEQDIFDLESFKSKIVEKTQGKQISLIASDWNMLPATSNYNEINALEVIEILLSINEKYKKYPFLIYSGKVNEASKVIISKIKAEISSDDSEPLYSLDLLSLLMALRIKFCARGSRFDEIKVLIKNEKTISLIVLNALSKFERNLVINTGNDSFDGRTIQSLLDLISQNNDLGLKFIREFIELSVANYSELNG